MARWPTQNLPWLDGHGHAEHERAVEGTSGLPLDMPEWKKNRGRRTHGAEGFRVEQESPRTSHGGSILHLHV